MKNFVITAGISLFFLILPVSAQSYPDTLWVPVTYFDFRSNGSNPEFECPHKAGTGPGGRHLNMVADTLDKDGLPVPGRAPYLNHYIKYWYRAWKDSAIGDYTKPLYVHIDGDAPYSAVIRYDGIGDAGHNTSFENHVIPDSLPFRHKADPKIKYDDDYIERDKDGNFIYENGRPKSLYDSTQVGVYVFNDDDFFPLDNRGFGNEGKAHNYSFAMKLHWEFTKTSGLTFEFRGDDDVWAFIDGKLQMDIGGIHNAITDRFNLDNISGLENDKKYALDFFYAERHTTESHIRITSNIISAPPDSIIININNRSVCAGDSISASAILIDRKGDIITDTNKINKIKWRLSSGSVNDTTSTLRLPRQGRNVIFAPTKAWVTDTLIAYLPSTSEHGEVEGTAAIEITACYPDHISIERNVPDTSNKSSENLKILQNDTELDILVIASNALSNSAHAIVRDKFGNFIKASQKTKWDIITGNNVIDSVRNGRVVLGEGIVYKNTDNITGGEGNVRATSLEDPSIQNDDVRVQILSVKYDSLRIALDNPTNIISKLTTQTADTSLLILIGYRNDLRRWEPVEGGGIWRKSNNLKSNNPLNPAQTWNFVPTDTCGNGSIWAKHSGNNNVEAHISVEVLPGAPHHLELYSAANGIQYKATFERTYTCTADVKFPLYAKIFDTYGVELTKYSSTTAPIAWSVTEVKPVVGTPTGTYSNPAGYISNSFTPTRARNIVHLVATFNEDGHGFSDSVRVEVVPGKPYRLTIQGDTASVLSWIDLSEINMTSADTIDTLYGLVRDKYDNFIEYARLANWYSRDNSVVTAIPGAAYYYGQGIIMRVADSANSAKVVVKTADSTLTDTVLVKLMDITYEELRIFVLDNGRKYIDTVKVRTDEDTVLYVEGRRSDGKGWDPVDVKWTISGGLAVKTPPPTSSRSWLVKPDLIDTGKVTVSLTGAVSDNVVLVFLPGLPGNIKLYKAEGDPSAVEAYQVYPYTDTLVAGETYPFVAKVFDRNNVWLSEYENAARSKNLVSWTISQISGSSRPADTLNSKTGHLVTFSPQKAYTKYTVTATFKENGKTYTASADVYIKPGKENHLVIENSSTPTGVYLNQDNPVSQIEFSSRDTVKGAYAVLRDKFGNFVGQSKSTVWTSLDLLIASAHEGVASLGEGRVIRTGDIGSTKVVAVNRNNTLLFDTVDVVLSDVSYDSLRIVIDGSIRIDSLVVRSGQDTTIFVEGLRTHDQVWVSVEGSWSYTSNNPKTNANKSGSKWDFTPIDTGRGIIVVTRGSSIPDTVGVRVTPGFPRKLAIYGKEGFPSVSNQPYGNPNISITTTAGTKFPLVGKVFDQNDVFLSEYEINSSLSNQITWRIEELPGTDSTGFIDDTIGHKRSFMPVRAYQEVYVISQLIYNGSYLIDTVKLYVEPGVPKQLVIEGSPNWQNSKNKANPISRVEITSNMTTANVYAILRDSIGNYVDYSKLTDWDVLENKTSITVRNGNTNVGEGVVVRDEDTKTDTANVVAVDRATNLSAKVEVILLEYYYTQLRIVLKPTLTEIDSVEMTTNDDTTLYVQGLRSDNDEWTDVSAEWECSSNLKISPLAPGWSHYWEFSPSDTGTGWIRVTLGNDTTTVPDSVQVKFLPGPPTRVTIEIITPPNERIAGDSIITVIKIYNEDGLVPDKYCFDKNDVMFSDKLGTGGRPRPFVLLGVNDTLWLDNAGNMCFNGGVDTVPITLFYVPYEAPDSLHQITVNLGGLTTITYPFEILPAAIDSLALEYQNGTSVPDTIMLGYPTGQMRIYSVGYDKYGNKRGPEPSDWGTDSTLHPIAWPDSIDNIFYDASTVKENESGNITATMPWHTSKELKASTFVRIYGPLTTISNAITRDSNGNGYLDHIEIHFSKSVVFPDSVLESMKIVYGSVGFEIEGVVGDPTRSDSVWVIALKEERNGKPQTAWTPSISFNRSFEAEIEAADERSTSDGAGPVIWKVTKEIKVTGDRTKDVVTVEFSEPVLNAHNGSTLNPGDVPNLMFYVWIQDPVNPGNYIKVDSMLTGIDNLQSGGDNVAVFTTSNNKDITARHFFTIQTVSTDSISSYLSDRSRTGNVNYPDSLNQKVRVVVTGPQPNKIEIGPNPTTPTERRVPAGQFLAVHEPNARRWVREDHAGTVITFPLVISTLKLDTLDGAVKLRCRVKVYDMVGNMVNSAKNEDILESIRKNMAPALQRRTQASINDVSIFPLDIYWNGYSKKKVRVAPSVYKVVVALEYHGSSDAKKLNDDVKVPLVGNVGIKMGK